MRVDYIGSTSLHGKSYDEAARPYEVRLRVAARAATREKAALVGEEVEALWTNGPGGGGGARKYVHEQVGVDLRPDRARENQNRSDGAGVAA